MHRRETTEVWNPDRDDSVFTVDTEGTSFDTITDDDGEYVGRQLTGDSVSFDFHFPTAEMDSEVVLDEILDEDALEYGSCVMEGQYVMYDMENDGAFNIGCESETQIVIHTRRNISAATIRKLYTVITDVLDVPVRVVKTKRYH